MRRPVRVALVDDEDEPRAVLREHLRYCEDELDVVLHTEEFSSGEQLLQDYRPTHDRGPDAEGLPVYVEAAREHF